MANSSRKKPLKFSNKHSASNSLAMSWRSAMRDLHASQIGENGKIPSSAKLAKEPQTHLPKSDAFRLLYDYAYQLGDKLERAHVHETHLRETNPFRTPASKKSDNASLFPFGMDRVWRDAFTRFRYQKGLSLSYNDFAMLAYLTDDPDAASRSFQDLVDYSDLYDFEGNVARWLNDHGFRPTLLPEDVGVPHAPLIEALLRTASFSEVIGRANYLARDSIPIIAAKAGVDKEWLRGLVEGEPVAANVEALTRIAAYFGVDSDLFVERAVRAFQEAGRGELLARATFGLSPRLN